MKSLAVALFTASAVFGQSSFVVYQEKGSTENHFIPSGWMGDTGDLKIDEGYSKDCHEGKTCIRIVYSAQRSNNAGWAGIMWQDPINNWGNKKGGFNLNPYTKLTFWAKGDEKNGYKPRIEEFKMGGITGEYSDSTTAGIGPIELGTKWEKHVIDLRDVDLSLVIGGFGFALSADYNGDGATFYLDDVQYE